MNAQTFTIRCEAVKLTCDNIDEVAAWCGGTVERDLSEHNGTPAIYIINDRQYIYVMPGEWIVKYPDGVCEPYAEYEFDRRFC